ncbi:3-hydroxyacyl-ACP dehydratase FabZ [Tepidamorphus sp. 3E244]|uniref:3-hydroxyacyl-ACP dehydratase FabZ n=1 Tax=Tepidamorphus sp. 3E244 TaxID=3385498 RepID=UPI0038FCADDD
MTTAEKPPKKMEAADILKIMEMLPHRYPFLLVDRMLEINEDMSGIGLKNVTANEPHFQGHFPDQPIMPGVLIVEGLAQTAGTVALVLENSDVPKRVYFMAINEAKFRRPVVPGDALHYHVRLLQRRRNVWRFAGEALVDGEKVAEAEMTAMITEAI